uniref:C-type lectin domain-containing protein n=1 Tax=Acrobeloides nanus TaxID=290746 RepID=A0A914EFP8_9BILA
MLFARYDGKWYSTNYETQLAFVCKLLEDLNDVGICLDGWTWSAKNHRCYKAIGSRNLSVEYASTQCYELTKDKYQTAILATIHSEYENRVIHTIASDHDSDFAYIGLWGNKYPDGSISWEWLDGSSVNYTNFSPNAPLVNSSAYAVLMNMNDGTWWLSDPSDNMSNNKTFHNAICMYESNE